MHNMDINDARILIVDDEPANVRLLERLLRRGGYANVTTLTDARDVLPALVEQKPDLILLDLHMPHLDGFGVMQLAASCIAPTTYLPILVLTADLTTETKQRALSAGATDFLTKPFDPIEVLLRVGNLLRTRALHRRLQEANQSLEEKVRERTRELEEAGIEILQRLALAAEFRDDHTHEHTMRVGRGAELLAGELGCPESEVELIARAAPLHDIGKIATPDAILLKPDRLTPDEFAAMQEHTTAGATILGEGKSMVVRLAARIALTHHERWDGTGYPRGLRGEQIPRASRIVSVVDVFDALTHARPYKPAWPVERALAEIERQCGRQFDPEVVEAFSRVYRRCPAAGEAHRGRAPRSRRWR